MDVKPDLFAGLTHAQISLSRESCLFPPVWSATAIASAPPSRVVCASARNGVMLALAFSGAKLNSQESYAVLGDGLRLSALLASEGRLFGKIQPCASLRACISNPAGERGYAIAALLALPRYLPVAISRLCVLLGLAAPEGPGTKARAKPRFSVCPSGELLSAPFAFES